VLVFKNYANFVTLGLSKD